MAEWEYEEFVWKYKSGAMWARISGEGAVSMTEARLYFWQNSQREINTDLQKEKDKGWQSYTDEGPTAINLECYKKTESNVNAGYVFYWIVTLGMGLLLQILTGNMTNTYDMCKPTEYRVSLRKAKG